MPNNDSYYNIKLPTGETYQWDDDQYDKAGDKLFQQYPGVEVKRVVKTSPDMDINDDDTFKITLDSGDVYEWDANQYRQAGAKLQAQYPTAQVYRTINVNNQRDRDFARQYEFARKHAYDTTLTPGQREEYKSFADTNAARYGDVAARVGTTPEEENLPGVEPITSGMAFGGGSRGDAEMPRRRERAAGLETFTGPQAMTPEDYVAREQPTTTESPIADVNQMEPEKRSWIRRDFNHMVGTIGNAFNEEMRGMVRMLGGKDDTMWRDAYTEFERRLSSNEPTFQYNNVSEEGLTPIDYKKTAAERDEKRRSQGINDLINDLRQGAIDKGVDPIEYVRERLSESRAMKDALPQKIEEETTRLIEENEPSRMGGLLTMGATTAGSIALAATGHYRGAAALGEATLATFAQSAAGASIQQAKAAGATDDQALVSGLASGAIMYAFSKIPIGKFIRNATPQAVTTAVRRAVSNAPRGTINEELNKLLTDAAKRGVVTKGFEKEFAKEFAKGWGKNIAESTASFASMSAVSALVPLIYEDPDNYPVLSAVLQSALHGAEDGLIMGTFAGGFSNAAQFYNMTNRWRGRGEVVLAEVNPTKAQDVVAVFNKKTGQWEDMPNFIPDGQSRFAEVIGKPNKDIQGGMFTVRMDDGSIYMVTEDAISVARTFDPLGLREAADAFRQSGYDKAQLAQSSGDPAARAEVKRDVDYATRKAEQERQTSGNVSEETQLDLERANEMQQGRRDVIRQQMEETLGQPFYEPNSEGRNVVRTIILPDGKTAYIVASNTDGFAYVDAEGNKGTISRAEAGEVNSEFLEDHLDGMLAMQDGMSEQERMAADTADNLAEVQQRFSETATANGGRINIGTPEQEVWGTVTGINPAVDGGVSVLVEGESAPRVITWDKIADQLDMQLQPKSDEQIVNDRIENDRKVQEYNGKIKKETELYLPNEITGENDMYRFLGAYADETGFILFRVRDNETGKETEVNPETIVNLPELMGETAPSADVSGNPVPTTSTTAEPTQSYTDPVANQLGIDPKYATTTSSGNVVVDGGRLWADDPETWAKWNDANPNRTVGTKEYLESKLQDVNKAVARAESNLRAEVMGAQDPNKIETLTAARDAISARQRTLEGLIAKYDVAETNAAEEALAQVNEQAEVPVDQAGAKQYGEVTPEKAFADLAADPNFTSPEEVSNFIDGKIKRAGKALEKAQKAADKIKPENYDTPAEYRQAKDAELAKLQPVQDEYNHWLAVKEASLAPAAPVAPEPIEAPAVAPETVQAPAVPETPIVETPIVETPTVETPTVEEPIQVPEPAVPAAPEQSPTPNADGIMASIGATPKEISIANANTRIRDIARRNTSDIAETRRIELMREKAKALQTMFDELSSENTVVSTREDILGLCKKDGISERYLNDIEEALETSKANGVRFRGLYGRKGRVYILADDVLSAEDASEAWEHENKHRENDITGAPAEALLTGVSEEEMKDALLYLTKSHMYDKADAETLADEILANAAEITERMGEDAVSGELRRAGIKNEKFITFVEKNIKDGRAQHNTSPGRNEIRNGGVGRISRENERDNRPGDRRLDRQRDRPTEEGRRGTESAEVGLSPAEQRLSDSGVAANGDEARFSVRYAPTAEEAGRIADDIVADTGVTRKEAEDWVKSETSLAAIILDEHNSSYLDYVGDDRYGAIKKDSDYPQGTVDFNNICRKRLPFTEMYQRLQALYPNTIITGEDLARIRQIMKDNGLVVACGLCYVEDRRQLLGEIARSFIDEMNNDFKGYASKGGETKARNAEKFRKLLGDDRKEDLSIYDLLTLDGSSRLYREHPGIYNAFQAFNSARGQQAGNLFQGYAEYKREILRWNKKQVDKVNSLGGLRVFSYSDFEAHHLIDLVQIIQDCARKGVKIQGYTKVPAFARAVANTGIKLNRSLIPLGDTGMVDGKLAYDPVEGIDVNDPDFLESNDNIGNILIGINDEQIALAMLDPFIHFIIPYHSNQSGVLRTLKQTGAWTNYKNEQTDKGENAGKHGVNIYTDVLDAAEAEGHPIKNKREFVDKFLAVCKERGLVPRFSRFLNVDQNGDYVYREGYHKFLVDFKLFDDDGNILPQYPVKAVFDDEFNASILNNYVQDERAKVGQNLDKVFDEIVEKLDLDSRPMFSVTAKEDADYMAAAERGDVTTAQEMAKKTFIDRFPDTQVIDGNGDPAVVLHGTNSEFNTFDERKIGSATDPGWLGRGFYFYGANPEYASQYGSRIVRAYLNIENPYYATEEDIKRLAEENSAEASDDFRQELIDDGYDGVFYNGDLNEEWVAFYPNQIKSADPITYDDNGNIIPLSERFNEGRDDIRYSMVADIAAKYPNWMDNQTTTDVEGSKRGQNTQVAGTVGTYKKVASWIDKNIGKGAKILDASSGLGLGTLELRKQGFDIEDIEPYPGQGRDEQPTYGGVDAYQKAMDDGKQYDYIISNAVLNVIPDDWRNGVLHDMALLLKPGGKMFINTRKAGEEKTIKNKIELESPREVLVGTPERITSYQRFFTPAELKEYVEGQLGNGYSVEIANAKNSGTSGLAAVVVTKDRNDRGPDGGGPRYSLTRRQREQVRSDNFKNWFGDWENDPENASKVVDERGFPAVVYHQTNGKVWINKETGEDWETLSWEKRDEWAERNDWDEHWEERDFNTFDNRYSRQNVEVPGFFFAPNEDPYHEYGDRTIAAYLNIKNPAIDPDYSTLGTYDGAGKDLRDRLISEGYDGIINTEDGKPFEYVAFYPNQIKSATDNNGDFSRENDDIRFSLTARGTEEENKALFDTAKNFFGTTRDLKEAGYILPDGTMLDFSGRHLLGPGADSGFLRGRRSTDHRDIESLAYERDGNTPTGIKTDMRDFILRGAIRIDNNAGAINLAVKPTLDQQYTLRRLIDNNDGNVYVDFGDGWDSDHYAEYDNARTDRVINDIKRYFDEGEKPEGNAMFSMTNRREEIFFSNAERSLDAIKQEKGTPDQWLKMIEKAGGLKAGEDKWIGLSDWLKSQDKKSLTKQEIAAYIRRNQIRIEEVDYADVPEDWTIPYEEEYREYYDEAPEDVEPDEYAWEKMKDFWGEDIEDVFEHDDYSLFARTDESGDGYYDPDLVDIYRGPIAINRTRLGLTTQGLTNKREIALTVPNIEPYFGELPEIHFADDNTKGKTVAWIRFGETRMAKPEAAAADDYLAEMRAKYGSVEGEETDDMTEEEITHLQRLTRAEFKATAPKVLVLDEIQSQRHQDAREKGGYLDDKVRAELEEQYKTALGEYEQFKRDMLEKYPILKELHGFAIWELSEEDKKRYHELEERTSEADRRRRHPIRHGLIPAAPFERNWHELAMKRMLRLAAEEGFDYVAWTTGDQQSDRYGLGKVLDSIERSSDEEFTLFFKNEGYVDIEVDDDGIVHVVSDSRFDHLDEKPLIEIVGKEMADKMMTMDEGGTLSGDDLKVGGEGMRGFYDEILPRFMNKYGKKWGVKVEDITLPNVEEAGRIMHAVKVTPEMRESVMGGQPMFSVVGDDGLEDRKQEVSELFNDAISNSWSGTPVSIGTLTPKGRAYLEKLSGVTLRPDTRFVLNPSDLRHIYADHFGENEKAPQNVPLAIDDIKNIVDVIVHPHDIQYSKEKGNNGRKLFYFLSPATDGTYNLLEVYSNKWGNLTTKTFYKTKKDLPRRVVELENSLLPTSETYSGSDLSSSAKIPTLFDITKGKGLNKHDGPEVFEYTRDEVLGMVDNEGLSPVIGEENRRSLYRDAYRAVPKEILSDVVGDLGSEGGLDIRGKFQNYLRDLVDGGTENDETGLLRAMINRVRSESGIEDLSDNEVRYMLWRDINGTRNDSDVLGYGQDMLRRRQWVEGRTDAARRDEEYSRAVESGDMETAQRMADRAAREAGYTRRGYHGSYSYGFSEFIAPGYDSESGLIWTTDDRSYAELYTKDSSDIYDLYIKADNVIDLGNIDDVVGSPTWVKIARQFGMTSKALYEGIMDPVFKYEDAVKSQTQIFEVTRTGEFANFLRERGFDGVTAIEHRYEWGPDGRTPVMTDRFARTLGVVNPNQVKSADPVTYDDNGNVVPLSERFKEGNDDIRFSLTGSSGDFSAAVQNARDGFKSGTEAAEATRQEAREELKESLKQKLNPIVKAMRAQKKYDQATVNGIVKFARETLKAGGVDSFTSRETNRLLTLIKGVNGKTPANASKYADQLLDLVLNHVVKDEQERFDKVVRTKGRKLSNSGVEVIGTMDKSGLAILKAFRDNMDLDKDEILRMVGEKQELMDNAGSDAVKAEARDQWKGLSLALEYVTAMNEADSNIRSLEEELEKARSGSELAQSLAEGIRESKMEKVDLYRDFTTRLSNIVAGSKDRAKNFKEQQAKRVEAIHKAANFDLAGIKADSELRPSDWRAKTANFPLVRLANAPLATFHDMLQLFGRRSVDGRGNLFGWLMPASYEASGNFFKGVQESNAVMDAKVEDLFQRKGMRWRDLYKMEDEAMDKIRENLGLPDDADPITLSYETPQSGKVTRPLSIGNALYVYMVNKMTDGRMKLRKMGIEEADVQRLKQLIEDADPRLVQLADWIQNEFLVERRNKYNAVYEKVFGVPMAAIEDYITLRINGNERYEIRSAEERGDNGNLTDITGSIITRQKNTLPIDILHTDAFSIVQEHIQAMEEWAAYAQFREDLKALLSYKTFENKVAQMSTIYGSGDILYKNFRTVCAVVAQQYNKANSDLDALATSLASGATSSAIGLRLWTAAKQFASFVTFNADASPAEIIKAMEHWKRSWEWCMENLPLFEKRWRGRNAGYDILDSTKEEKDILPVITKMREKLGVVGMLPNAFVDAITVAMGAKATYETKLKMYLNAGFDQETAEKKAKFDAQEAFNTTQQSSEGAHLSEVQAMRTWFSSLATMFRNGPFGFTRRYVQAVNQLSKYFGNEDKKGRIIDFEYKRAMDEGLNEEQARAYAESKYNRGKWQAAVSMVVMGFLAPLFWNLMGDVPYFLLGNDPEKKKKKFKYDSVKAFFGPFEGLLFGGNLVSSFYDLAAEKKTIQSALFGSSPLLSDIESAAKSIGKDNIKALNEIIVLASKTALGINPETLAYGISACIEVFQGNFSDTKEFFLFLAKVMNVPQSQIEDVWIDELQMEGRNIKGHTTEELAQRYANYKVNHEATFTNFMYSPAQRKEAVKKKRTALKKKVTERQNLHKQK